MKKLGSLFLVIIMLVALCGCSEESTHKDNGSIQEDSNKIQSEYVGTWKGSDYYRVITLLLKEDGTGTYTDAYSSSQKEPMTAELEWSYDQTNHTIDVFFPKQNRTFAFEIKENDGKTYLQQGSYMSLYRE